MQAGRGKSRLGQLDKEKSKIMETLTITKSEYKKQMKILYDQMPKVLIIYTNNNRNVFCGFVDIIIIIKFCLKK